MNISGTQEVDMVRAILEDTMEIASLLAFILMIAVWALVLSPIA